MNPSLFFVRGPVTLTQQLSILYRVNSRSRIIAIQMCILFWEMSTTYMLSFYATSHRLCKLERALFLSDITLKSTLHCLLLV